MYLPNSKSNYYFTRKSRSLTNFLTNSLSKGDAPTGSRTKRLHVDARRPAALAHVRVLVRLCCLLPRPRARLDLRLLLLSRAFRVERRQLAARLLLIPRIARGLVLQSWAP